jgi:O-antigen/teichoic acid export membrane protein
MRFNKLFKYFGDSSSYRTQVAKLASGNVIAAVIPFLFQPLIARLYSASDYSILGWYMSFVSILSVFATGKYELAIILPESDKEAKNITILSLCITAAFSLIVTVLTVIFFDLIAEYIGTKEIIWIFLIGPGVLFYCSFQAFFYLANRYSLYNSMSISKVNQNAVMIILQLLFGLLSIGGIGLVFGRIFGYLVSALVLGWFVYKYSPIVKNEINRRSVSALSKTYKNFPKHLILSNLMSAVYTQLPFLYIAKQFNSDTAGQFSFAMQMITVPGIIVANAIGDVYRQKASELFKNYGRFDTLFLKTLKSCLIFSIVPFLILILFSVPIFEFVFGESWTLAGKFASVLSIMTFVGFSVTPVDKSAIIINKTNFEFWYQVSRFSANVLIIIAASILSLSVFEYLYLLVFITIIHHAIDLMFSYKFSYLKAKTV